MALNNNRDRQRTRVVFVPVGGGGSNIKTEELSVSENGTYEAGEDKAYSKVTVKVTEPLGTVKIAGTGMKLGYSSFSKVPEWVDFEGVTDMNKMFYFCGNLSTIPEIDSSKVTDMTSMFDFCKSLTTIPLIDTSSVTSMGSMLYRCYKLTDLGGFIGLKCDLDLYDSPLITHESLLNVINKAADVTASPATLTLGSTNLAKLTDEEKAIATNKGWTLA